MHTIRLSLLAAVAGAATLLVATPAHANHCTYHGSQTVTQDAAPLLQQPSGSLQTYSFTSCNDASGGNDCNDFFVINTTTAGSLSMNASGDNPTVYFTVHSGPTSGHSRQISCSTSFTTSLPANSSHLVRWRQGGNSSGGPWAPYTLSITAPNGWTILGAAGNAPTITPIAPQSTDEDVATGPIAFTVADAEDAASALVMSASSSDTSVVDPTGVVFGGSGANRTATITPALNGNGAATVTLTVTDSTGLSGTSSFTLTVNPIADPPNAVAIPAAQGPTYAANEGSPIAVDGTDTSHPDGTTITGYSWDCDGDGNYGDATGATASCPTTDDGTIAIGLQVTDSLGAIDTDTASAIVANVAPTATATGATVANEGGSETYTATGSDPSSVDQAALTYSWDLEDANGFTVMTGTGTSFTATFPDDGNYSVQLSVSDPQGAVGSATVTVAVANVAPTGTLTAPAAADEGDTVNISLVGTDPSPTDQAGLALGWTIHGSNNVLVASGTGSPGSYTFADDDVYTITTTVSDPQGDVDTDTATVTVSNIAPVITSAAPTTASEGVLWSYQPAVTDPGAEVFSWTLVGNPNISLVQATGEASWTPTFNDSGVFTIDLTVDDGDGGVATESFALTVTFIDDDSDGMPDTWETQNGLDPTTDDSTLDPDGDGLDNLAEWNGGSDPNVADTPTEPVPTSPIAGAETELQPTLAWDPATDPQNDPLTYDVEVYADAGLGTLLASTTGLAETGAGVTWTVDVALPDNADAFWRVRASDPLAAGPWTDLETIFVNSANDPAEAPVAVEPLTDDHMDVLRPWLRWTEATDIDRDALVYTVRLQNEDRDTVITSASDLTADARDVAWEVDVDLSEDTWYSWDVRAVDEHGLEGAWSEPQDFFVSLDNARPTGLAFTAPEDGARLDTVSPTLRVSEATDPEGSSLTYRFQLDTADTFDSGDLLENDVFGTDTGEVEWDLAATGDELTDNVQWYARVRATDEGGAASRWAEVEFYVVGPNDPPAVPALLSPADGTSELGGTPVFAIGHVLDPEGDALTYSIRVSSDPEGENVLASVDGLLDSEGPEGRTTQTSWAPEALAPGTVYWTARSEDEGGAQSEWAEAWTYVVEAEPVDEGCGCESSFAAGASSPWLLALLALGLRRRR